MTVLQAKFQAELACQNLTVHRGQTEKGPVESCVPCKGRWVQIKNETLHLLRENWAP